MRETFSLLVQVLCSSEQFEDISVNLFSKFITVQSYKFTILWSGNVLNAPCLCRMHLCVMFWIAGIYFYVDQ